MTAADAPCAWESAPEALGAVSWAVAGDRGLTAAPFLVAGVVNVTPDSFYDGGRYAAPDAALAAVRRMVEEGVQIADIGGESTRPGAPPVDAEEESRRVLPVLEVAAALPIALAVDTYKATVAARCLQAGAVIINDVSACRFDPELLDVLVQYRPGYVLMHSQGRPETMQRDPHYTNVLAEVREFFETQLNRLVRAGLPEQHVVLDPGIGFGKRLEHNLALLRGIEQLQSLGRPLYVGLSNKSLWGQLLQLPLTERGTSTQVATALLAARGVRVHRVHDTAETLRTLRIVQALQAPDSKNFGHA